MIDTTRRQALRTLAATAAVLTASFSWADRALAQAAAAPVAPPSAPPVPNGPYTLPPLPYAYDALAPHIDAETMRLHHDKHHATYVVKLNEAVAAYPDLGKKPVDDLLRDFAAVPAPIQKAVRNHGGGHANHSLFWTTLGQGGGAAPQGALAKAIDRDLGGFAALKENLSKEAVGLFGSGWAWVSLDPATKKLLVETMPNQDSPLLSGRTPLFGIDVWEHAYYLPYRNRRADYVKAFWNVVNWKAVDLRYEKIAA